jgi:hypothetical protein
VDETIDLRQAEPGSLADLFGEEWIEDLRQKIGRNAAPVSLNCSDEPPFSSRRRHRRPPAHTDGQNVPPLDMASRALTAILTIIAPFGKVDLDRPPRIDRSL